MSEDPAPYGDESFETALPVGAPRADAPEPEVEPDPPLCFNRTFGLWAHEWMPAGPILRSGTHMRCRVCGVEINARGRIPVGEVEADAHLPRPHRADALF